MNIGKLMIAVSLFGPVAAHAFCFDEAGVAYNVNSELLKGIAKVESGLRADAMNNSHIKRTGTVDIGLMQINSSWLPTLAKQNITRETLLSDPCMNVKVGAWILARTMAKEGANWNGVGAYNAVCSQLKGAACEAARMTYANKVWRAMNGGKKNEKSPLIVVAEPQESKMTSIDIQTTAEQVVSTTGSTSQ